MNGVVVSMPSLPAIFVEVVVGVVTCVWATSFVLGIINPRFDSSTYNSIFMAVVGSGVFAAAFTHLSGGKTSGR